MNGQLPALTVRLEWSKLRCDPKEHLSDTSAIPHEHAEKGARPPLRYYLEKVLRSRGVYVQLGF